jgi:four helix bundle protein
MARRVGFERVTFSHEHRSEKSNEVIFHSRPQACRIVANSKSGKIVANQIGRAGTSVGANYRAACRGRSKAEFVAKLGIVEEEADECAYWLELIGDGKILPVTLIASLKREAEEIIAIMAASRITASGYNRKSKPGG